MSTAKNDRSQSVWMDQISSFPSLQMNFDADVCIVGAGIAGVTCGYLLAREGKTVVLLDAGRIGSAETGHTTAHLSNAVDDRYVEIEQRHGANVAKLVAQSHTAAIALIKKIIAQEKIDCDWDDVDGYLFFPKDASAYLEREFAAAKRAGIEHLTKETRAPLDFNTGPALRFGGQGQCHPLKYLNALLGCIRRDGGSIFANTPVTQVKGGSAALVTTQGNHKVRAKHIIIATNTPVNNRLVIHTKQAAYTTYVIGAVIPPGSVEKALYWDDPAKGGSPRSYHYIRTADEGRLLIVGGEDHKTGQENHPLQRFTALENWARKHFATMGSISYRWSGQVMEPVDGMAYIGRNPLDDSNVFIATGDSGMGITHGTIAGRLLTDLICDKKNEWEEIYSPARKPFHAMSRYLQETCNMAAQYSDWLTPGDKQTDTKDSGTVVRRGLSKVAIYRDSEGAIHSCSAVCPHLGGIVSWNAAESTWDCPCHGSRFNAFGKVLHGPAISDLHPQIPQMTSSK